MSEVSFFIAPLQIRAARIALLLMLAMLPWPLVAMSLYHYQRWDLAFLCYHGLCLMAFFAFGATQLNFRSSRLVPVMWMSFALGVAATLVVRGVVDAPRMREMMVHFGFAAWQLPLLGAYFLLVNPALEEAFWRGTIFHRLSHDLPTVWACALSSVLFGSWHALVVSAFLPSLWLPATFVVMLFGVAMTLIYHHSGRTLGHCTLVHAIGADLPLLVVLALAFLPR